LSDDYLGGDADCPQRAARAARATAAGVPVPNLLFAPLRRPAGAEQVWRLGRREINTLGVPRRRVAVVVRALVGLTLMTAPIIVARALPMQVGKSRPRDRPR
jgi:hypothetical protein